MAKPMAGVGKLYAHFLPLTKNFVELMKKHSTENF